jgi:putative hydrolase of the HAD superfamily
LNSITAEVAAPNLEAGAGSLIRAQPMGTTVSTRHTALAVDFGGVLTTSIWVAFRSFCEAEGLEPDAVRELFKRDSEAIRLLRSLETGEVEVAEFEPRFGALLGVVDTSGLVGRLFAGIGPDEAMIEAVRLARRAGVRTGLISNSWGIGIYDGMPDDLFDATVISGEVGLHKPQPGIYRLACERLGVDPAEAIFVDDLRENCTGAEAVGLTAILHRDTEETIARLEELLGLGLGRSV